MTEDYAMRLARSEYRRLILEGMGIFLIAEAWGIETLIVAPQKLVELHRLGSDLPSYLRNGYGLLTEPYVLSEMAKQIREMGVEEEEESNGRGEQGRRQVCQLRQVS
ncbi:MAG: hypothetical protein ACPGF7_10555 [Pontibacterium sp.]